MFNVCSMKIGESSENEGLYRSTNLNSLLLRSWCLSLFLQSNTKIFTTLHEHLYIYESLIARIIELMINYECLWPFIIWMSSLWITKKLSFISFHFRWYQLELDETHIIINAIILEREKKFRVLWLVIMIFHMSIKTNFIGRMDLSSFSRQFSIKIFCSGNEHIVGSNRYRD